MEQIRQYFERTIQQKISEKEWMLFSSKLSFEEFPKRHIILRAGQTENHLSFVETGIVRYFIPKLENNLTFTFVFDNNFMSAYDSFITRTPSPYQIETLTKATLWRITFDDLQTIYEETEVGNLIGRKASEDLYLKKSKRELSLLNETAEQRYQNLFLEQPHLIQYIPLKYIASYIGVTPQALSRIRRRIT
ncbi:Crp/Fnr family transcriptional regulator [Reichenbachiella agarivorans]|uniref:Crp/Fnr family transcriptional regulator n=1 Tax=Reichenbachiella agarivorans TaxID=2979464 RepID=A0ABY6CSQ6_9BACT|nr:Crp/Fnr family transcriptional regulator [Reichenbachiella agarivorans]UXP33025.1 Crp/Fnr family transcriptional regulator [Reichenbachiella agarivorans]